jgi:hypothetical protein
MADCSLASPHQPAPGRAGGDIALLNQPTGQGGLGAAALTPTAMSYGIAPPGSYGLFPPHPVFGQVPSVGQQGAGQNGHGELPEPTKRAAVEMYLSQLSPQELGVTTASSVVAALVAHGIPVEETYAGRILGEWRVAHPAPTKVRRKGGR